jgi:hypothetical protein
MNSEQTREDWAAMQSGGGREAGGRREERGGRRVLVSLGVGYASTDVHVLQCSQMAV